MKQLTDIVLRVILVSCLVGLMVGVYFAVKFLTIFGPILYTLAGVGLFGFVSWKLLQKYSNP